MKTSTMRLWNIAKVGLMAIARNKMRSLLTMLGIIIGVACVITMVAVGTGVSSSIQATINSLGTNFIMLFPGAETQDGARIAGESRITVEDVEAIRNEVPSVAYVSPSIRIKNVPFRVVGVLDRKGGNMMGQDQDDQIIAPYTTVMKQLQGRQRIGQVLISARSASQVAQAQTEIDGLLRQRHRIGPGQDADFTMRSQEEIASTSAQTSKTLSVLLGSAAAIGIFFGFYPARKASRLDPIDALRYE